MLEGCNLPLPVSIFLWSIAAMMFVTLLIILLVFISMAMEDARIWRYQRRQNKEWEQRKANKEMK